LQPAQVRRRGRGRPVEETGPVGQPVQLPGGGRAGRLRPPPLRGTQPAPQLVGQVALQRQRSEEYTSELQSQSNLVCRLLLEKKIRTASVIRAKTGVPPCGNRPLRLPHQL